MTVCQKCYFSINKYATPAIQCSKCGHTWHVTCSPVHNAYTRPEDRVQWLCKTCKIKSATSKISKLVTIDEKQMTITANPYLYQDKDAMDRRSHIFPTFITLPIPNPDLEERFTLIESKLHDIMKIEKLINKLSMRIEKLEKRILDQTDL